MTSRVPIETFEFIGGFDSSLQPLDPRMRGRLAEGSFNVQTIDNGRNVPFGGLDSQGGGTGSRILSNVGNTWGGIKDIGVSSKTFVAGNVSTSADTVTIANHGFVTSMAVTLSTTGALPTGLAILTTYYLIVLDANTFQFALNYTDALAGTFIDLGSGTSGTATVIPSSGTVAASGSIFQDIGASIWGIGSGQPHIEGTNLTHLQLSSLLKVLLAVNGSYSDPDSGAFVAGLSQPSTPDVAVLDTPGVGYTGLINGAISIKLARIRVSTGARSIASVTSAVVVPAKKTIRVTFPLASTGQTYWHMFATQQGYGGVGIHYQVAYNGDFDIAESVVAAGVVDGIDRSLEIDYRDGDLLPIEAYIDDYPPPAGTQAARVESCLVVFGCYSDSESSPSNASPGTCAAVSLPNYPESYKPRHILFFPEPIVGVLSRLIDSYCYILCRNSIHAVQFVGWRNDLPSCTVTTVSPDVGVKRQCNAVQAYGRLFLWTEKAGAVAMQGDGSLDYEFGAAIRKYTKDWDDSTVVGFDPLTRSVTYSNGTTMFLYCLQSGAWSSPTYLDDYATGNIEASVTTQGKEVISLNASSVHTSYFANQGATSTKVLYGSNWSECGSPYAKNIFQAAIKGEFPIAGSVYIGIHSDFRQRVYRDASVTINSYTISAPTAQLRPSDVGREVFLFKDTVGSREFEPGDVTGSVISINGHGMRSGERVKFSGTGLIAPLVAGDPYYVTVLSVDTFSLYSDPNEPILSAVTFTNSGTSLMTLILDYLIGRIASQSGTAFIIEKLFINPLTPTLAMLVDGLTAIVDTDGVTAIVVGYDSAPLPRNTLSDVTLVIADQVFTAEVSNTGSQNALDCYPEIYEGREISATVWFETDASTGQIYQIPLLGDNSLVSEINVG